jgi:hypothetical protein
MEHKTKYYGIWVVEDHRDMQTRYFIQSDNGDEYYAGNNYPTEKQIDMCKDWWR